MHSQPAFVVMAHWCGLVALSTAGLSCWDIVLATNRLTTSPCNNSPDTAIRFGQSCQPQPNHVNNSLWNLCSGKLLSHTVQSSVIVQQRAQVFHGHARGAPRQLPSLMIAKSC